MKGDICLKQAVEEYKDIYLAYRNFAPRTRVEYVNDIEDMVKYLDGVGVHTVNNINLPNLIHYLAELEKRGYAGSTRKRKTISIRSFLSFLYVEGYILSDIGKRIIPPYVEAHKPRFLTTEETNHLLVCVKNNKRDYAIIQLLLHSGIKLSELVELTLHDLHTSNVADKKGNKIENIRVRGHLRGKERIIPINPVAGIAIADYLTVRVGSVSENLFLNRNGESMGARGVEKVSEKYFKIAGIENVSVNALRHTFGALLANNGTDIKTIQKVMGLKALRLPEYLIKKGKPDFLQQES